MSDDKKPWWFPTLTDDAWLARIRSDYPDSTQGMSDDALREKYADGNRYATTWDHTGDAYEQFEEVADALAAAHLGRDKAVRERDELRKAAASLVAAVESYAQTNGWIELSEGIIGGTERLKALLPPAQQSEERKG